MGRSACRGGDPDDRRRRGVGVRRRAVAVSSGGRDRRLAEHDLPRRGRDGLGARGARLDGLGRRGARGSRAVSPRARHGRGVGICAELPRRRVRDRARRLPPDRRRGAGRSPARARPRQPRGRLERDALGLGRLAPRRRGNACLDGRAEVGRGLGCAGRQAGGGARRRRALDTAPARRESLLRRRARLRREPDGAFASPHGRRRRRAFAPRAPRRPARQLAARRGGSAGADPRPVVPRRARHRRRRSAT